MERDWQECSKYRPTPTRTHFLMGKNYTMQGHRCAVAHFELQPGRSVCFTLNNKEILGVNLHQLCQGVDSHHIPAIVASTDFEAKFPARTMLRYETNKRVLNSSSSALPFHEEDAIFRRTSLDLLRSIVPHDFQEYLENEEFINSDIMFAPPEQHSD